MAFFEQNRALDYSKAKFDKEYALRFTSITNHREIFTAWNVKTEQLASLIEKAKELIPNQFIVEYHSPYTTDPMYIGPNGLMLSPFRFNSKYNPNIKNDFTHNVRVDDKTHELIKRFVSETNRQNRFFIQNCLVREFTPNRWVKNRDSAELFKTFSIDKNSKTFKTEPHVEITPSIHSEIIKKLQESYDFISFNNGIFRFSDHYLHTEFYNYWIEKEFEFEDKHYSNWLDAFLDACLEAEQFMTDVRLPIESSENSIFKNEALWKPYRACLQELMDVIQLNKDLEKKISDLKISLFGVSGSAKTQLEKELKETQTEATLARRKRVYLNIRNLRQVKILYRNYIRHFVIKKLNNKVTEGEEALQFKFSYLEQLRKAFLKEVKKDKRVVLTSYKLHDAQVLALNHRGHTIIKGQFQFSMNASFINILFSKNIGLFEGVSELIFTLKDGKTVFHFPSYTEQGVSRYKMGGVAVKLDVNIHKWVLSFFQDPQDLIVQACLNQGERVLADFKNPSSEVR